MPHFIFEVGGTLLDYFWKGGVVMWPLLACSIIGITIIIERLIAFKRIKKIHTAEFMLQLRNLILAKKIQESIQLCDAHKGPIPALIKAGLLRHDKSVENIQMALENAAVHEVGRLERGLTSLATVANVAPLLGFLGTVTGMIRSFDALAKVGLGNPAAVASGISEALITTAAGLFIAIPTQFAHNFFVARINSLVRDMEISAGMFMETLKEPS